MNIDNRNNKEDFGFEDILSKTEPNFSKTKSDVWDNISVHLDQNFEEKQNKNKTINIKVYTSIAATIIILFSTYYFLRNYTQSYYSNDNNAYVVTLPSGSIVTLESQSALTYYPLWWRYSRRVELSGGAFFEVEPGNKFIVNSALGSTEVVGTSFSIVSHSDTYTVKCVTGKVKVKSKTHRQTTLTPEYQAHISLGGRITVSKFNSNSEMLNDNTFRFTSTPLSIVISELKQHYNININTTNELDYLYSGVFSKNKTAEDALTIICKPFGLTFVKNSDTGFIIIGK